MTRRKIVLIILTVAFLATPVFAAGNTDPRESLIGAWEEWHYSKCSMAIQEIKTDGSVMGQFTCSGQRQEGNFVSWQVFATKDGVTMNWDATSGARLNLRLLDGALVGEWTKGTLTIPVLYKKQK